MYCSALPPPWCWLMISPGTRRRTSAGRPWGKSSKYRPGISSSEDAAIGGGAVTITGARIASETEREGSCAATPATALQSNAPAAVAALAPSRADLRIARSVYHRSAHEFDPPEPVWDHNVPS